MARSEHDEAKFYKAYLEETDRRLIVPARNGGPSAKFRSGGGWRECRIWEGYLHASWIILKYILDDDREASGLIFPAFFNLRHGVEVALKWHIGIAGGSFPSNAGHNLKLLLEVFCQTADDLDEEASYLSYHPLNWIREIAEIDPHAMTFRYSTDRRGAHIEIAPNEWDIRHLYFVVDSLSLWFDTLSNNIELSRDEAYQAFMRS